MTWCEYHAVNVVDGTSRWFKRRTWTSSQNRHLRKWSICLVEKPMTEKQYNDRIVHLLAYNSIFGKTSGKTNINSKHTWIWKCRCPECNGPIILYPGNKWWTKHTSNCVTNLSIQAIENFWLSP